MKKLIVLLVATAIAVSATGQTPMAAPMQKQPATKMHKTTTIQSVMMKDGKVWQIVNGKSTELTADVTIGGAKVSPDGTVVMPDGMKTSLKEGQKIGTDGKITEAEDIMPQKYPPDGMDNK